MQPTEQKRIKTLNSNPILHIITLYAIVFNIYSILIGFNYNILDQYGFRQAQTAISIYYYVVDGIQLDYLTPVFGYPWRVPFEFPTYQVIVALLCKLTHIGIDQSGRIVSIFFFYLCFLPLNATLNKINVSSTSKKIIFILLLLSPVYIFWSRTVLIESVALFLSLSFIYYSLALFQKTTINNFILCTFCLTLGALTKVTTILPSCVVAGLLILHLYKNFFNTKNIILFAISGAISLLLLLIWTHHADAYKDMNFFSKHITSSSMNAWNFGTLSQRLSITFWRRIVEYSYINVSLSFFILIGISILIKSKNVVLWIFFFGYCSGILIFAHLYYEHSYYYYANCIFAFIFMGILIGDILKTNPLISYSILLFCIGCLQYTYFTGYYQFQSSPGNTIQIINLAKAIRENSKANDVVLICGDDWNSQIPYYSRRRAIMNTHWASEAELGKIVASTKDVNVVAINKNNGCQFELNYIKQFKTYKISQDDWNVYIKQSE
ncbi:MAG: glycosyl transferase, family 39 [Burkholderiales bacterium]|jgi:hypothetical protein|nr:glycosyl transferase, family 39 [Burkholderiales bacterium]